METLEAIQMKIKRLQSQAEAIVAKQTSTVLANIRDLMDQHGLTVADIEAFMGKKRGRKPGTTAVSRKAKPASKTKGKLSPKYMNPKTGETWSGHARPPAWIKDVKDRSKFLIAGAGAAADAGAASKPKTTAKKAVTTKAKKTAARKAASTKAVAPQSAAAKKVAGRKGAQGVKKVATRKVPARKAVAAKKVVATAGVEVAPEAVAPQATA